MTFQALTPAARGTARLKLEYSNSRASGSWTTVAVPDTGGVFTDGDVTITGTGPLNVTASKASGGKLCGRANTETP